MAIACVIRSSMIYTLIIGLANSLNITVHLNIYAVDKNKKRKEEAAKKICEYAMYYKVCEGCESVILFDSTFCPVCEGYRFDEDINRVIRTASALAKKEKTDILPSDDFI
jgi:RNA polymerase subunit RPABC4/transcription elongation factor Spt4